MMAGEGPYKNRRCTLLRVRSALLLTGLPLGERAPAQNRRWVASMLGSGVPVITRLAREEPRYAPATSWPTTATR